MEEELIRWEQMMIPDACIETVLDIWTKKGKKRTCSITGNSMAPLIKHGDTLFIEYGNKNIRVGDVVVFKTPTKILAHRLIHKKNKAEKKIFLLKGDRCDTLDQPITKDQILGKVVRVLGSNGNLFIDSAFWKFLNYFLSILSGASQEHLRTESALWKGVGFLFTLSSKIFPKGFCIRLIFMRGILKVHRIRNHVLNFA